jgi:hypothetical protein
MTLATNQLMMKNALLVPQRKAKIIIKFVCKQRHHQVLLFYASANFNDKKFDKK